MIKALIKLLTASAVGIGLLSAGVGYAHEKPSSKKTVAVAPTLVWPNEQSKANSDDWLRLHHNQIYQLRPKVLVLNFANGMSQLKAEEELTQLFLALRESSRYHGYNSEDSTPGLEYQLFKYVDLTDKDALPDDQVLDGNSSLYPRVADWKEGINFKYGDLFSDKYSDLYAVPDPAHPGKMMSLKQMVDTGTINEVWFMARQGKIGAPYECTEVKQAYDAADKKIPGKSVQAGNGGSAEQPFVGRSLRILFINVERGIGCAMESLGHAIEGTSNSGVIPEFTRYFSEFAGFDLKKKFSTPFNSFYELKGGTLDYPESNQIKYTYQGKPGKYLNYYTVGGNVHFAPNARKDYDLSNTQSVMSTIEHYRLKDGMYEKDMKELWTISKIDKYKQIAPDCQGPWMVYWRQNFPANGAPCIDDYGKPMKGWLPYLFY